MIPKIVHDIDIADRRFGRSETAGIERLLAGIQAVQPSDADRLTSAAEGFEGLYRGFGGSH